MKLVRAFEVPDLSAQSQSAVVQAQQLIDTVVEGIEQGNSFIIYPSGRLQRTHLEKIGSNRLVHEVVSRCPSVTVVLVRTRGLWGSLWGCARTGQPPDLTNNVLEAAGWLLASLVFFLPRRNVHLHVETIQSEELPTESREGFNKKLEDWFNVDAPESPIFVRYNWCFGPRSGAYQTPATTDIDTHAIDQKTMKQVNELVALFLKRDLIDSEQVSGTRLEDLGLDSLDRMDLALRIEQQFGFQSDDVVETLGGLWSLADGKLASRTAAEKTMVVPKNWFSSMTPEVGQNATGRSPWLLDETVAAAFTRRMIEAPEAAATGDPMSGVLSRRRLLVAANLMAQRFARIPQQHVGVMLPASVAADIVFYAMHLAGKTPVMMNWTTGPSGLAHGIEATGVRQVVTSSRLVDRLGITIEGSDYVFLEDVKKSIKKTEALGLMARTYLRPTSFLRNLPKQDERDPAVFLFTSGSESAPKTVPLTHRNLLTNIHDSLAVLQPDQYDSLLGFLPPFHSFGLTGNVLLPQLSGIRSIRYADPTDAPGLVRLIGSYKPSMLFATPTFLGYILANCSGDEMQSLRKIITGAEACPEATHELCAQKAPEAIILEGYGITECSPVVAANRIEKNKHGSIGKPVEHVEAKIVHHETLEQVQDGETGMLLVRGDSIFDGYHAFDGPSPFVEVDNQQWYRTGDLVSADDDGYLQFQGRLKRFLKAGGEMISLPALEAPFQKKFPADENGPRVAVEGIETAGGRMVVLFTTTDIEIREASDLLLEAGLRGVMRLDAVQRIDAIPVLGTGKTDYKSLRVRVEALAEAGMDSQPT
jgi:long-chain-fatty-acid--[acyl-carrier-protein] ligase